MYVTGRDLLNSVPPVGNTALPLSSGSKLLSQPPGDSDYSDYVIECKNESLDQLHNIYLEEKAVKPNSSIWGDWLPHINRVEVKKNSSGLGSVWNRLIATMGYSLYGKHFLYPEEALFLCECCLLHLTYQEILLSIQQAFNCLLDPNVSDCTLSSYIVYGSLARVGYIIRRHHAPIHKTPYQISQDLSTLSSDNIGDPVTNFESLDSSIIEIDLKSNPLYSLDLATRDQLSWRRDKTLKTFHSEESLPNMTTRDALIFLQKKTNLNFTDMDAATDNPVYNVYSHNKTEFSRRRMTKPLYTIFIKSFDDFSFSCPLKISQQSQTHGSKLIAVIDNGQVNFYQLDCNNCPTLLYNLPEPDIASSL